MAASRKTLWKKGRGKLGVFDPLLGTWTAKAETPLGPVSCTRTLAKTLNGSYLELRAEWKFPQGSYLETALIGVRPDGKVAFWSFTSDGNHSEGELAESLFVRPLMGDAFQGSAVWSQGVPERRHVHVIGPSTYSRTHLRAASMPVPARGRPDEVRTVRTAVSAVGRGSMSADRTKEDADGHSMASHVPGRGRPEPGARPLRRDRDGLTSDPRAVRGRHLL